MTRPILRVAAITLSGVTVVVVALIIWSAATPAGSRWLLKSIIPLIGVSFSAKTIDGSIIDHLHLTGVRLALPQQRIELDSVELRWKPQLLLTGTVFVDQLHLDGVRIQNSATPDKKPPVIAWPKLSGNTQLFDGRITQLRVTELSYSNLKEPPVSVTSFHGSVSWQDGIIAITDLNAVTPAGRINGSISAGFEKPLLSTDLTIALTHPIAKMNKFTVKARPGVPGPEPFVGAVSIAGSAGTEMLTVLSGDIGLAGNAINLRHLNLTRPGHKGDISADGSLAFTTLASVLSLQIKVSGLDLAPELDMPTDLSGTLTFAGNPDRYRGTLDLANNSKGWQSATLSATYQGTSEGMKLAPLTVRALDGSMAGNLDIDWRNGIAMAGAINGRKLNPARLDAGLKGIANFNATGNIAIPANAPLSGSVSGVLLKSSLHGQALTGQLQAGFADDNVTITRLTLRGKGFDLHASGDLKRRLIMTGQVSDLSGLVPGSAGELHADGWLRRRDGRISGAGAVTGNNFAYAGTGITAANVTVRLDEGAGFPFHAAASLRDVSYDGYRVDTLKAAVEGTLQHHAVHATVSSDGTETSLALSAGYNTGIWQGVISRLEGRESNGPWRMAAPTAFSVGNGKFSLASLLLTAGKSEHLEVAADLTLNPLNGHILAEWADVNLARANPYLKDLIISGSSHGKLRLGFLAKKQLSIAGSAGGSGTLTREGNSIPFDKSLVTFDGNEQGVRIGMKLNESGGGRLTGTFSSSAPLRLAIPEEGTLAAELVGLDLALFKSWLPADTRAAGRVNARASGTLFPGQRFNLSGNAQLSGGALHQKIGSGVLNATVTSAAVSWGWSNEILSGDLDLVSAEYGKAQANFHLPVPARFPVAVNPKGALRGSINGDFKENGIISALFPDSVRESAAAINCELTAGGSWEAPQLAGKVQLAAGGAYFPAAGIRLQKVKLSAQLQNDLILIDSFQALSGPGKIEGTAVIKLAGWQLSDYHGTIKGTDFQTVHLPELNILVSPLLNFEGTPKNLKLRGDLLLPELRFIGAPSRTAIAPSGDVIIVERVLPLAKSTPLALDVQVRVLLGERVFVNTSGIEAQLGGAMELTFNRLDTIVSSGEIKVIKGRYRTYGVNLDIVRGRLFFAGGPIDNPSLDILALRTVGDARAGVTVIGTIRKPVTRLFSEPAMPDVDVLAYIVLGRPLGNSGEQASLVSQAAGALLTSRQASVLQDKIKNQFGLSTLEIQGDVGKTNGSMGYKPLQVTAPGEIQSMQQPGITETMLTVGKHLTPELYISYGRSLFTGSNLFLMRYDFFKQWQIETQTGSESGADLFYKLEFM